MFLDKTQALLMNKAVVLEAMVTINYIAWSSLDTSRIKPLPIKFLKEYRNLKVSSCGFCVSIRLFITLYYLNRQTIYRLRPMTDCGTVPTALTTLATSSGETMRSVKLL